jgi:hypothetical protein
VADVVDHLILGPGRLRSRLRDEVLHAIVACRQELPFPGELEVVELFFRDDVVALDLRLAVQRAVDDGPAIDGCALLVVDAPAVGGLAVEEQRPAGGLFATIAIQARKGRGFMGKPS